VIKFTSCLPMVGGSLQALRLLPPLKLVAMNDIAEILLKMALNTINKKKSKQNHPVFPTNMTLYSICFSRFVCYYFICSVSDDYKFTAPCNCKHFLNNRGVDCSYDNVIIYNM